MLLKLLLTKHPDVAGGGEASEVDALGGHPLDGQLPFAGLQNHVTH